MTPEVRQALAVYKQRLREYVDATDDGGEVMNVSTTESCSYCHEMNALDVEACWNCGHDAHKPRVACECSVCHEMRFDGSLLKPVRRRSLTEEK